jgi:signal transduction histidine kinase/HPt (histidine-containing phosphotransfer) domain-containing protein
MKKSTTSLHPLSWRSLPNRVTVITLCIFIVAIWTMAGLIESKLHRDLEVLLGEQQQATVSMRAGELNREIEERLRLLGNVTSLMALGMNGKDGGIQKTLESRPALPAFFNGGLFVTDAQGTVIASIPQSAGRLGLNYMDRDHVASALKDGKSTISKPVLGKALHSPVVSMAAPIRNDSGTTIGALVGVTDLGHPNFMERILTSPQGKTGAFSLYARQWNMVISGQHKSEILRELGTLQENPTLSAFVPGKDGYVVLRDTQDTEVLASAADVPVANWLLVASLPTSEAFALVYNLSRTIETIALLATLMSAMLTWWLVRRQLMPVHTAHAALTRQMGDSQSGQLKALPQTGSDEVGQLIGAFNALLKVLQQRETALAANEERMALAVQRMNEAQQIAQLGNWTLNLQDITLHWSDEIYRIFELDPGQFSATYEGFLSCIHPDDRELVNKAYGDSLVNKSPYQVEHRLLMRDGRIKWVQERCQTEFDAHGKPLVSKGTVQDITERKDTLRSLAESRDLLMAVIDAIPMRVFWKTPELLYLGCNTAFAQDAGKRTPDDLIGKDDYAMGWSNQADLYRADDMAVIHSGVAKLNFEEPQTTPEGGTIWLRTSKIPLINTEGECFGVLGLYEDITERRAIAVELDQYRKDLEAKVAERTEDLNSARLQADSANRSKSEFLANMSHEIRTPMNGVVGMVDVLKQTAMSPEQTRMLNTIHKSSMTLLSILNDILDFSKIEAGKLAVETVPTPIRDVVESVAQLMVSLADDRRVELSLFVDPALPTWVDGDPTRLRQVLLNLLSNGLKFSAPGEGKVLLSALPATSATGAPCLQLSVTDNGIGMDANTLDNLFQPFTQADASTMRKFGGTGLGLSITQRLVTMMGGSMTVTSTPQRGSRFSIELPLRAIEAPAGQHLADIADLGGVSVLAVTPSTDCMTVFQVYLGSAGASVEVVADLAAARARMAQSPANTVLLLDLAQQVDAAVTTEMLRDWGIEQRVVRLVRRSRSGTETHVIEVRARPLIYHDLINGVALACGRKVITDIILHKEGSLPQRQAPSVEEARAQGRLILLAEDNEINRDVIAEQLRLLGYASELAHDGVIALHMWQSGDYALLLTDCHMPNMDGYELTEAIRKAQAPGTHVPIIAITANAMQGEAERCRERGMDDYLSKPLRMQELDEKLQRWLPLDVPDSAARATTTPVPLADVPVPTTPPALAVWDSLALNRVVGNNPAMHRRLLEKFLGKAPQQLDDMTAASTSADLAALGSTAHALKSAARTVGAMQLGEACQAIETTARSGDHAAAAVLVQTLPAHLASARASIEEHLS